MNKKVLKKDRWFNPFWSIWLNHLMSRPPCNGIRRKNGGSSLVVCNTDKGKEVFCRASEKMYGHELKFEDVLRYQAPLRKNIDKNPMREEFMHDLKGSMEYKSINRKWAERPTIKLLILKYIWGNRQKVALWNLKYRLKASESDLK